MIDHGVIFDASLVSAGFPVYACGISVFAAPLPARPALRSQLKCLVHAVLVKEGKHTLRHRLEGREAPDVTPVHARKQWRRKTSSSGREWPFLPLARRPR